MKIGVISDTHGRLPAQVFDIFADVQVILHAGDVQDDRILDELESITTTHAVSGNVDGPPSKRRPQVFSGKFGQLTVCMTHGHLFRTDDYTREAVELFRPQAPDIIVHGHTHVAKNETCEGVIVLNPGAVTRPRKFEVPSVALILLTPGGTLDAIEFKPLR